MTVSPEQPARHLTDYERFNPSPLKNAWELSRENDVIEIRRNIKLSLSLVGVAVMTAVFLLLSFVFYRLDQTYGHEAFRIGTWFFFVTAFVVPLLASGLLAICVRSDKRKWPLVRFRYDKKTGMIRIARFTHGEAATSERDDFTINRKDCPRVFLGWTSGYTSGNIEKTVSPSGQVGYKRGMGTSMIVPGVQFYILLQTQTGEWKKFFLAAERSKRKIEKTMSALALELECPTLTRSMTVEACAKAHVAIE